MEIGSEPKNPQPGDIVLWDRKEEGNPMVMWVLLKL